MANCRKNVADNLIKWDHSRDPLAPLMQRQRELLSAMEDEMISSSNFSKQQQEQEQEQEQDENLGDAAAAAGQDESAPPKVETWQQLLQCYTNLEDRHVCAEDVKYTTYLEQLKSRHSECDSLCLQIGAALQDFAALSKQYAVMSGNDNNNCCSFAVCINICAYPLLMRKDKKN